MKVRKKVDSTAAAAHADGVAFYPTGNERVWLCDALPAKYLRVME
ncbi:MAG: hypothetical protein U0L51_02965 [Olegusella sp.]|nr:hypothetical protein [Olegusella sp.]